MPIVFAQPEPLSPSTSLAYGAAQMGAQMNPGLVSLYDAAIKARSGGGGGGSGGGGGASYAQVLPSSDYGAFGQVEQQANREQQAMNLGFAAEQSDQRQQQDFSNNIGLQNNAAQLQQSRINALNQQYGQQAQQPPPATFDSHDQKNLDDAQNTVNDIKSQMADKGFSDDPFQSDAPQKLQEAQSKIAALQKQQQAAQEAQSQQQFQQASKAKAQQDSLVAISAGHLNKYMPTPIDDIPGMPKPHYVGVNKEGLPVDSNEKIRLAYANHFWAGQERDAGAQDKANDLASKQQEARNKLRGDAFNHHLDKVHGDMKTWDSDALNMNKQKPDWYSDPMGEARKRADAQLDYINGAQAGPPAHSAAQGNPGMAMASAIAGPENRGASSPGSQPMSNGQAQSRPQPGPALAQIQVQRADSLADQARSLGLPTDHRAEVMSALAGAKELMAAHGGNLASAPKEVQEKAKQYRDILLKYGPKQNGRPYQNPDARTAQALATGGY